MTPSEIIAAARQAGLHLNLYAEAYPLINEQIQCFAAIIAAKQREKDAQIADSIDDFGEWGQAASIAAKAIRGQE